MPASIDDLTNDILTEIFLRVPIKTVGLSRCVCKPWQALLTTPRYIKLHLIQSKRKSPNLLVKTDNHFNPSKIFKTLNTDNLQEYVTLNLIPLPPWKPTAFIGSYDGLVCIWDYNNYLSLLNPSTGELVQVPVHPRFVRFDDCWSFLMGFGFDPETERYKVVCLPFITNFYYLEIMVYTVGADSAWRIAGEICSLNFKILGEFEVSGYRNDDNGVTRWVGDFGVHVNGVLHWGAVRGSKNAKSILCFDLRNETIGEIPWFDFKETAYQKSTLGEVYGCLATFHSYYDGGIEVWVMQGSWIKILSLARPPFPLRPLLARKNGDILLQMGTRFLLSHDPVNEKNTFPVFYGAHKMSAACSYVEALTSISEIMGGNGVEG